MECIAKVPCRLQPLNLSLNSNRPSFHKPISSLSFGNPPPPPSPFSSSSSSQSAFKFASLRASSSRGPSPYQSPKPSPSPSLLQTLNPLLKTTCITLAAAAGLLFSRIQTKPAIAAPVAASSTVEPASKEADAAAANVSLEEQERNLENHLARNPNDVEALRLLMEVRIKSRRLLEAIEVVERLIELEPEEKEWPLLKAQLYSYGGDSDSARKLFEEMLEKDPLRVEAYHGLVMANSEAGDSLQHVLKRIEVAMKKCKSTSDVRDFKLLVAQVKVMEEKYGDALKVYDELVKEEPRDFRPYLCQGIIYTLLRKKDEAEKKFDQFRKLVPKNHPYREFFLDNMFATKFFSEKTERGTMGARS